MAETSAPDSPRPPGRSRRAAFALIVLAVVAIGFAALGAAADRGPFGEFGDMGERAAPQQAPGEDYNEAEWDVYTVEPTDPRTDGASRGPVILMVLGGVLAAVLILWIVLRMRRLAPPTREEAAEGPPLEELTLLQAQDALEEARERLSSDMDAQDAVIAAWLSLERAIAAAGIRRRPAQTTLEYVLAVLGSLDLDTDALTDLSDLYRRALFDATPLRESDRERASSLLEQLSTELSARGSARGAGAGR